MTDLELGPIFRALRRQRTSFVLVVLELASGFVIISSLLITGSWYLRTAATPPGYDESHLVTVLVHRPAAIHRPPDELATLAAVPGVAAAAPLSTLLAAETWAYPSRLRAGARSVVAWSIVSSPALADVIGLRFAEGDLPPAGIAEEPEPVMISRSLRTRLFSDRALGRPLTLDGVRRVVVTGVFEDVLLRERMGPTAYFVVLRFGPTGDERQSRYLLRARPGQQAAVVAALPAALGGAGPDRVVEVAPSDVSRTHRRIFSRVIIGMLFMTGATIAAIALLGVLAVSSFLVTQRTRPLGIRRALGATRGDIIRYILIENALSTLLGTIVGLGLTLALCLKMERIFEGLVVDARLLVVTAAVLWLDCTAAALIPARRAARIPPSVASRSL